MLSDLSKYLLKKKNDYGRRRLEMTGFHVCLMSPEAIVRAKNQITFNLRKPAPFPVQLKNQITKTTTKAILSDFTSHRFIQAAREACSGQESDKQHLT